MPEPRRQLVAIMFTDILGYTAIMGKDEQKALALLKKNKEIHERLITQYNGKLLKEIGDGILASFSSVSEAVYCAGAIQKGAKEEEISLRIGIHEGEVVFQDNDIFGDGVNIASRIEALATTGEILLSESAYKNIKNKEGIQTDFVKEESLKNVDEPVRIYRVSVDISETDGISGYTYSATAASSSETKPKSKQKILIASIGIALAILAGWWFWTTFNKADKFIDTSQSSEIAENNSLAVMYFENLTGNESLNWLQAGMVEMLITNLGNNVTMNVLSSQSLFSYLRQETGADNLKISKETSYEIARKAKVTQMLLGSYLGNVNALRINIQLVEVNSGRVLKTWKLETDESTDIFDMVDSLTILIQLFRNPAEVKTPALSFLMTNSLDAQKYYIEGLQFEYNAKFRDAILSFEKAISSDSTFALAYYHVYRASRYMGNPTKIKNPFDKAIQYKHKLAPQEAKLLELNKIPIGERIPMIKEYLKDYPMEKYAWYMLGDRHIHGYWPRASLKSFYRAIKIDPYFLTAYAHIMDYYSFTHNFDSIRILTNKVLSIEPDNNFALRHIANMNYYETGNIDNYISELNPDVQDTLSMEEMRLLALTFWLNKEYEGAIEVMQKYINQPSSFKRIMLGQEACMALSRGQEARASNLIDIILTMNKSAIRFYQMGLVEFIKNNFTNTLDFANKIMQLEELIPEQESYAYHLLGIGNLGLGNFDESKKAMLQLEKLVNSGDNEYEYMFYDLKARVNMAEGNFIEASKLFEQAKTTSSFISWRVHSYTYASYGLIECLAKQGKYADLINEVNKMRFPSYDQIWDITTGIISTKLMHQKARALVALGKIEEGKRAYDELLELLSEADSNFPTLIQAQVEVAELD